MQVTAEYQAFSNLSQNKYLSFTFVTIEIPIARGTLLQYR